MKIVKYYDEIFHAHIDRQLLEGHGIPAELFNEMTGMVIPYLSASCVTGKPYLAVPDSRYTEAMEILSGKPETERQ